MDPISLIPRVLNGIQTLSDIIREVKVNKRKCQRLGERIEVICETLKPLQEPTFIITNIQIMLDRFCKFIDECTDFVRTFVDVPPYKRFYARRTYHDEFGRYDIELSNYNTLLQLAINIAVIGTVSETRNTNDQYTLYLADKINALAQTQSTTTERTDKALNELREDVSNFAQIIHSYDLQLKHIIEVHQQILALIADKNKKHSGIFRRFKKNR